MLGLKEYLDVREKKKDFPVFIKIIAYFWLTLIFFELNIDKKTAGDHIACRLFSYFISRSALSAANITPSLPAWKFRLPCIQTA